MYNHASNLMRDEAEIGVMCVGKAMRNPVQSMPLFALLSIQIKPCLSLHKKFKNKGKKI